jgi:hypothetical protein
MTKTALAALFLTAYGVAHAEATLQGDVCYSNWTLKGYGGDGQKLTLMCDAPLGTLTTKELYARGWRVVAVVRTNQSKDYYAVFIEEQARSK